MSVLNVSTGVALIVAGIYLAIRNREVAVSIQNYYANMRVRQKRARRGRLAWLSWPGFVPSAVQARAMGWVLSVGGVGAGWVLRTSVPLSFAPVLVDRPRCLSYISDMKVIEQTDAEAKTVAMLRAIAHPARFRIVKLLAARQACVCGDIVDELPLAQSTVSEHLKVLKDAGIVRGSIDGPNVCYCLEPAAIEWLKREFGALSESCC